MKFETKKIFIYVMALYFLCLPLGAIKLGNSGSILKVIGILPVIVVLLSGKKINIDKITFSYIIYALFTFLSIAWSINTNETLSRFISYFEFIILMLSCSAFSYSDNEINTLKHSLIWSSRITLLLLLFLGGFYEERLTFTGIITEDPNYLCMYFSFGILFCIENIKNNNIVFSKKIYSIIELLLYLYAILSTGSRGGLLAIVLCCFLMVIIDEKDKKSLFKKSIKKIILILIILISLSFIINMLSPTIMSRFNVDSVIDSGGTGRTILWTNGIGLFNNSSIFRKTFGYGGATIGNAFSSNGYFSAKMHNIFLEQLIEIGIIGLLLYLYMLFSFIKGSNKLTSKYSTCLLIGFIIMSLSTSLYAFKPYINVMLFIIIQMRRKDEHKNESTVTDS